MNDFFPNDFDSLSVSLHFPADATVFIPPEDYLGFPVPFSDLDNG